MVCFENDTIFQIMHKKSFCSNTPKTINITCRNDYCFRTIASRVSAISIRSKHETKEEKKVRKQAVKQLKHERRMVDN